MDNTLVSYARYLGKMIWPVRLACFYPAPHEWPLAWVLGAALLLTALTALCVWQIKRAPYLAVGWFWYLGTLVPVIGIVQVGLQSMADRYTYLPLIGLFIAGVWAAADWGSRQSRRKAESRKQEAEIGSQKMFDVRAPESGKDAFHRVPDYARNKWDAVERVPAWLMGVAMVALLLCGYLTWRQAGCWRTTASLFTHALAVTRDNEVAQNDLGACLLTAGNVAAAEPHLVEALRIRPRYADALANLATCLDKQGRVPEAIDCFQRALEISPAPIYHYDLANLLRDQGRLPEAEAHYQAALRLRPYFVEAWYNLGALKQDQGDAEAAAQAYATALQFRPDYTGAHLNLGQVLALQHKWDEAIAHLRTGLRAAPQNAEAHFLLGAALASQGHYAEAAVQFAEACRLRPEYPEARASLGQALFYQGKLPEAVPELRQALEARPSAKNHYYLALALHAQGQLDEALPHYREAARLEPNTPSYLNDLAWILATHPKAEVRDGTQAVRLAEAACRLTGQREPLFIGTLAAAYAETGRFADAVNAAGKAMDLAAAAGLKEVADKNRQLIELYRAGKPVHETEEKP
jgi:tetratricopeptide (TPR) repeat protein